MIDDAAIGHAVWYSGARALARLTTHFPSEPYFHARLCLEPFGNERKIIYALRGEFRII